jgi:hypothetical protein
VNQWVHLALDMRFAQPDKASTFDLSVRFPDGQTQVFRDLPSQDANWSACDWAVLYGLVGEGRFWADNLLVEAISPDGKATVALHEDFESLPEGPVRAESPLPRLIRDVAQLAPPPVAVRAPDRVRVGVFHAGDGRLLVHLHNLDGTRKAWLTDEGPEVRISTRLPVATAALALRKTPLTVLHRGGGCEVVVPHVGLHEVVELTLTRP